MTSKQYKAKKKRLWDLFRITPEEEKAIEQYQRTGSKYKALLGDGRYGIDHRHYSGQIYGCLDWRINKALGYIESVVKDKKEKPASVVSAETIKVLKALLHYMEQPPALAIIGKRYGLLDYAKYKKKMEYGPK